MAESLRLLIIGAHPDDADYAAGGTAALYRAAGHEVKMISMTDGGAGHHISPGPEMVKRRRGEAAAAGAVIGATYETLNNSDGGLLPTLETRGQVIRLIRTIKPDLVLTHRPNDYHPPSCSRCVLCPPADLGHAATPPAYLLPIVVANGEI